MVGNDVEPHVVWPKRFGIVSLMLTVTAPALSLAWEPGTRKVTLRDLLPHLRDEESYGEQWSFDNETPNGGYLNFQIVISNLGIGDHKAKYKVRYKGANGAKSGKSGDCRVKAGISNVSGKMMASIKCGPLRILEDMEGFMASFSTKGLAFNIRVKSCQPPWRPASGKMVLDKTKNKFYDLLVHVPRGDAKGIVIVQGQRAEFEGVSFADHSVTTATPDEFAKESVKFKRLEPDYSLVFTSYLSPAGERFSYVLAATRDCKVFGYHEPRLHIEEKIAAPNRRRYSLPVDFSIETGSPKGSPKLTVKVTKGELKKTKDMLDGLNSVERLIARHYSDPFGYSMSGHFQVSWLEVGKTVLSVKTEASYLVEHFNP